MKKLISSIMFATVLCFCSIVLFACGNDATVSKVSTSLSKTYATTANIDFSKFVLTLTYSDEKTENILASDIEFDINYADEWLEELDGQDQVEEIYIVTRNGRR